MVGSGAAAGPAGAGPGAGATVAGLPLLTSVSGPLGVQDAQRLPSGTPVRRGLLGQLGLGGHALAGPQLTGPDPGQQGVGHLAVRPPGLHNKTLQLPAIFVQFGEGGYEPPSSRR